MRWHPTNWAQTESDCMFGRDGSKMQSKREQVAGAIEIARPWM